MSKVDYRTVDGEERRKMMRELSRLLLSITNERDMLQLLYRLFTPSEIVMIGRRMQIAELMVNGWSYHSIQEELNVGLGTIKSVDRWLEYIMKDYDRFRSKQKQARNNQKRRRQAQEWAQLGSLDHIRRKYPLHFLVINVLLDSTIQSQLPSRRNNKSPRKKSSSL